MIGNFYFGGRKEGKKLIIQSSDDVQIRKNRVQQNKCVAKRFNAIIFDRTVWLVLSIILDLVSELK